MSKPATRGGPAILSVRTIATFVLGGLLGGVLVAPVLPGILEAMSAELGAMMVGSGLVIAVGVGAFTLLMVLLLIFYKLTIA